MVGRIGFGQVKGGASRLGLCLGLLSMLFSVGPVNAEQEGILSLVLDWEAILNDFLEPHIYDVVVFDDSTVMVVGEFELVLLSGDGGDNWEVVNKADSSLSGIYFTNRQNGYAAGQNGKVLKTVDGGLTWEAVEVDTQENLLDVWASGDDVYIPGIRTLLRSRDAGASWESITEGDISVRWYQSIKGTPVGGGNSVVMVGHSGRILKIKN